MQVVAAMAVSLTPALSQRARENNERARRNFHGNPAGKGKPGAGFPDQFADQFAEL